LASVSISNSSIFLVTGQERHGASGIESGSGGEVRDLFADRGERVEDAFHVDLLFRH
jgi:hypothetical protein